MDHPDLSNPQKASARRRLIRGGLAAPAVMTVLSGSAFAAASTSCAANAQNLSPQPPAGVSQPDTTYLRVQLYRINSGSSGNGNLLGFFIRGQDLGTFPRDAARVPVSGSYLEINPATYATIGIPGPRPGNTVTETAVPQWAAMRFDASGRIIGIGTAGTSGGAVLSLGCWQSAFPGA